MLSTELSPSDQPPAMKSAQEVLAYQARLLACLEQTNQALLSLSVSRYTANDWAEARFMIRQLQAEIDLLSWVLGLRPTTWLDDSE